MPAMTSNDIVLWLDLFEKVDDVRVTSGKTIRAAAAAAAKAVRPPSEFEPAADGQRARYRRDSPYSLLLAKSAVWETGHIQGRAVLRELVVECRRILAVETDGGRG